MRFYSLMISLLLLRKMQDFVLYLCFFMKFYSVCSYLVFLYKYILVHLFFVCVFILFVFVTKNTHTYFVTFMQECHISKLIYYGFYQIKLANCFRNYEPIMDRICYRGRQLHWTLSLKCN